jgi:hypothetical protein
LTSKELEVLPPLQLLHHVRFREEVEGVVRWVLLVLVGKEEEARGGPEAGVGVCGGQLGVVGEVLQPKAVERGGSVGPSEGNRVVFLGESGEDGEDSVGKSGVLGRKLVRGGFKAAVGVPGCEGVQVAWVVESDWKAWSDCKERGDTTAAAAQQLVHELLQV